MIFLHPLITYVLTYCLALIGMFWEHLQILGGGMELCEMGVLLAHRWWGWLWQRQGAGLGQLSLSLFTKVLISLWCLGSSLGAVSHLGEWDNEQWFQTMTGTVSNNGSKQAGTWFFWAWFLLLPVITGVSIFPEQIYKNIHVYTLLVPWAGAGKVPTPWGVRANAPLLAKPWAP